MANLMFVLVSALNTSLVSVMNWRWICQHWLVVHGLPATHSYVSAIACTVIPIANGENANVTDSTSCNYRGISLSSVRGSSTVRSHEYI